MPTQKAEAAWHGTFREGEGKMRLGSGAFEGGYSYRSRMEEGPGTNPEELLGAAHAGCFSMSLARRLEAAGYPPERIHTEARVRFGPQGDRKSTRLNSSHAKISYAVFCLKKK